MTSTNKKYLFLKIQFSKILNRNCVECFSAKDYTVKSIRHKYGYNCKIIRCCDKYYVVDEYIFAEAFQFIYASK